MKHRAWMTPNKDRIGRSLYTKPTGRSPAPARRRNVRISALLAFTAVAVIVASAALLPNGGEPTDPAIPGRSSDLGAPPLPYYIYGWTNDSGGVPVPFSTVTITNVDLGGEAVVTSQADGRYMYNLANMAVGEPAEYYENGDLIRVEAEDGSLSGMSEGYVVLPGQFTVINVTLDTVIPEFPMVIAPVAGILAMFIIVRSRRRNTEA